MLTTAKTIKNRFKNEEKRYVISDERKEMNKDSYKYKD